MAPHVESYRMYPQRFVGMFGLAILTAVGGLAHPWFGPIADVASTEFRFSLNAINWLGIAVSIAFLPSAILVPHVCKRFGIRITCCAGSCLLVLSGWIRYSGTIKSLSPAAAYALIVIGQILAGAAAPLFQVLGPRYSENWFDLKGRTTATMIFSIASPVGGAIAGLVSPRGSSATASILILAIIYTVAAPFALLVGDAPPTPPTYAASRENPTFSSFVRALRGREPKGRPTYMSIRERFDFAILTLNYGVISGVVTAFTILSSQNLKPYGYSGSTAGLLSATLLISGLVCALGVAPLFDRVLTRHLALTTKIFIPILGAIWLGLIWAVKPGDTGALFAMVAIIGACSIPLVPVAIELTAEITRNASGGTAVLVFAANAMTVVCVLVEGALRAGPNANPPNNTHRAIIFQGVLVMSLVPTIFGLKGKQARREMDERKNAEVEQAIALQSPTP
ncbi:hypothetical protein PHLGIDRAFT_64606 [Phlebiopsis gigantea 11061_1 CR5-6]|uniref:Major facilitator superfamily (MFS) profile domain-containing protein n=1 Tax=Phlebiopsis gigantea (strain 11061_1 CR5-6) TaxID=745531 RepID=A0A0C3SCN6_PHLG1|nr:hypothetical protein PHLGIDRAFT_64606 [Phlebiopsis gigantea 11061_1 CR5-6]